MFILRYFLCILFLGPLSLFSTLTVPYLVDGSPQIGKRVKVYLDSFPESYYVLFLPKNFSESKKYPVIFESPGNCNRGSRGVPEDCILGYGLSQGVDYIWVSVPIVDNDGLILQNHWEKNPIICVKFWLCVLQDLNSRFIIDNDKIVLVGFSRGAMSASFIGNFNDDISSKWCAYFAHSHFDGCYHMTDTKSDERINRFGNRKVLISYGSNDNAASCSRKYFDILLNKGIPVSFIEVPNIGHSASWILDDSDSSSKARSWLYSL